jgi:hypothetical protein
MEPNGRALRRPYVSHRNERREEAEEEKEED